MSVFSDDDLKRLKEQARDQKYGEPIIDLDVKALLDRLEAAERIVEDTKLGHGNCICKHCAGNYEAWKKASGK